MTREEMMKTRRMVRVTVALPFMTQMTTQGAEVHFRVTKGLPEGAEYVANSFDARNMAGYMFFYHPSFEPVKDGGTVPEFIIEVEDLKK